MGTTFSSEPLRHFLVASDFDQTLSFNDPGIVLSERLGVPAFDAKVEGLRRSNLVHQGGELAYLIRHDPEFRSVRREHLVEAGRGVRLKTTFRSSSISSRTASRGSGSPFTSFPPLRAK